MGKLCWGIGIVINEVNPYKLFLNELSQIPLNTHSKIDFSNNVANWMTKMAKCLRRIQNNGFVFTDLIDPKHPTFFVLKITKLNLEVIHKTLNYKWIFKLDLNTSILQKNGSSASLPEWESFFDILDSINKKSQSNSVQVYTIQE